MISSSGVIKLEKKIGLPQVLSQPWPMTVQGPSGRYCRCGLFGFITGRTVHMTTRDGLASDVINAVYPAGMEIMDWRRQFGYQCPG